MQTISDHESETREKSRRGWTRGARDRVVGWFALPGDDLADERRKEAARQFHGLMAFPGMIICLWVALPGPVAGWETVGVAVVCVPIWLRLMWFLALDSPSQIDERTNHKLSSILTTALCLVVQYMGIRLITS